MQLKNEFSWSKSRDEVFKECKRKYYFDKYGSWNGWNAGAGERTKKLYQLKKLSTRQVWLGKIIHEAIEHFLTELKAGNHLPLNTLLLLLNQELRSRYQSSEAGLYRTFHKKGGLIEHEHNKVITKEEKEELFKLAEKCVRNFYNSEVLKEIKSLDVAKWLSLEEFLSFDFEGIKIAVVSPEDLIISKLFWAKESHSEMQIKDVKNLIASVENLDYNYIKKWVKELGIENIFNEALN